MNETSLGIKNLVIHYETDSGVVETVNGMNLVPNKGQSLGLVSETGAGKTTVTLGALRPPSEPPARIISGEVHLEGRGVLATDKDTLQEYRDKKVSMIFQGPMTFLNLVMTIGEQVIEPLEIHEPSLSGEELAAKAQETLEMVDIREGRLNGYPRRFSGGMKQKVVVAIALYCSPELLIADEPTTALDVIIQTQMLDMIRILRNELQTPMILTTHDLGLVVENYDMVAIIYAGEIAEHGNLADILENARHLYTAGLSRCTPNIDKDVHGLRPTEGLMPDSMNLPDGCLFHDRREYCIETCQKEKPADLEIAPDHTVKCHLCNTGEKEGSK